MNWEKVTSKHFFKEPVEHIFSNKIFATQEYDRLYENQNNLNHQVWQEFDKKYKTGFEFLNDVTEIDKKREVICLWFFRERNDRTSSKDITLADKEIRYAPNTFLITRSKDLQVYDNKRFIRRPLIQIDLSIQIYNKIINRLR